MHETAPSRRRLALSAIGAVSGATLLALASDSRHSATWGPLFVFHLSFLVLLLAALPAPRSHVYTALALMLTLGYWPKFLLRLFEPRPYLEPVGAFDGSPAAWDRALLVSALGVTGVLIARLAQLTFERRHTRPDSGPVALHLYNRYRGPAWAVLGIIMGAAYVWNSYAAVYITGVNPRVILPLSGNVVLAWCYTMAFPLAISLMIGWELARRRSRQMTWELLGIAVAEALVNAASLMSRATYLLHIAPYLLATAGQRARGLRLPRPWIATGAILAFGFALSVAAVMFLRTMVYFGGTPVVSVEATPDSPDAPVAAGPAPAPPPAEVPQAPTPGAGRTYTAILGEVGTLFLDRWTGLEGVLAITAADAEPGLLGRMIAEDPKAGTEAIYQRIAAAEYERDQRFTFLTLAGIVAVLASGGNLSLIVAGMALLTMLLMAGEWTLRRATGNELACATVAMIAGFITVQVTFPQLYAVFLLELGVTIAAATVAIRLMGQRASSLEPSVSTPSA